MVLKIWSCLFFNEQDVIETLEAFTLQADWRKLLASVLLGFVFIARFCLKQWVAITTFFPDKSCVHLSLKTTSKVAVRKKNSLNWDDASQGKAFTVIEIWEWEWWRLYNTTTNDKLHIREHFPYRRSLTEQKLFEAIKKGNIPGYVQCDNEAPKSLSANFANFSPFCKNTLVSKNGIGDSMKTYAEEEAIMSEPGNMSMWSFTLENGTLITPLLLFYVQLGLVVTKIHRSVENIPKKCSNCFLQSTVDARRQNDENPNSIVVAATMKLQTKSSYGFQNKDRSWRIVTK